MSAKLLDLPEDFVNLQRILAQDAAFQEKSVSWAGTVAHFTKTANSLIGVDSNEGARARSGFHNGRCAKIRNPQVRRPRVRVDVLRICVRHFFIQQRTS